MFSDSDKARFLAKTASVKGGCIEWTGFVHPSGYGMFSWRNKSVRAHRAAWLMAGREIPDALFVLHRCDNRRCVNPEHLFVGTHGANMADMVQKGRRASVKGVRNPRARLTANEVDAIRADARSQRRIAAQYGICKSQVGNIKRGEQWPEASHV